MPNKLDAERDLADEARARGPLPDDFVGGWPGDETDEKGAEATEKPFGDDNRIDVDRDEQLENELAEERAAATGAVLFDHEHAVRASHIIRAGIECLDEERVAAEVGLKLELENLAAWLWRGVEADTIQRGLLRP